MLKDVLKKNTFRNCSYSVNGQKLSFHQRNFNNVGYEFTIRNDSETSYLRKKCTLLSLIIVLCACGIYIGLLNLQYCVCIYVFSMCLIYGILTNVKEERLLVIPLIGYQTTTSYTMFKTTKFIPWNSVAQIFINEVITKHTVIFILTACDKEQNNLIPLFTGTKPRLELLEIIYRKLQEAIR